MKHLSIIAIVFFWSIYSISSDESFDYQAHTHIFLPEHQVAPPSHDHNFLTPYQPSFEYAQLEQMSTAQLYAYFSEHDVSEQEILHCAQLYKSDSFIAFVKTFDDYAVTIAALYKKFSSASRRKKISNFFAGCYYPSFAKKLKALKKEINSSQQKTPTYALTKALAESHSFQACAHAIHNVVQDHDTRLSLPSAIADSIDNAIDELYQPSSEQHFVFNAAYIERMLSNAYDHHLYKTTNIVTKTHRCSYLFKQALSTFITQLNPVTQIQQWGDFIINTAHFVADITVGKLYLSEHDYQQRMNTIRNTFEALSWDTISQITVEQWVDMGARYAADCVYVVGVAKIPAYLKELNCMMTASQRLQKIARSFRVSIDVKLEQHALVAASDGTILTMSVDPPKLPESVSKAIALTPRASVEMIQKQIMASVREELPYLQKKFHWARKGFLECRNKYIKINYEHIFGIDTKFNKRDILTTINGYHLDYMNILEKSGMIEFYGKVMYKDGFYKATLRHRGRLVKPTATFFPAHWTREQVIEAIIEAFDDFVAKGAVPIGFKDGIYRIQGATKQQHVIEMLVTITGKVKTVYPLL